MRTRLSIASICRSFPNPEHSSLGIFVFRRIAALASSSQLTAIQPVPYFPFLAPLPGWARSAARRLDALEINHAPMFYVPKVLKSLDSYWLFRAVLPLLMKLKVAGRLDVVDSHFGYPEGVGALFAARRVGVPCFVTLRGFEAEYIDMPVIGSQIKYLLRSADGCICVSHFLKELALEHGAAPSKTRVIHNAIDRDLYSPGDRVAARQKLGLSVDAPTIVTVGHLINRKRHHVVIAAFARVLKRHPGAKLLIIGDQTGETAYVQRLRNQIEETAVGGSVDLIGNIEAGRVSDYLRAADVFALGTQREGCCNAILEALACGLPVVTTPVGDNTWFVKDGDNGLIVPVDDVVAMEHALLIALSRKDWDKNRIAAELQVGDWNSVAALVLEFFNETMKMGNVSVAR
jgi:glycosyltransferase involved in cell wall biosynthesis